MPPGGSAPTAPPGAVRRGRARRSGAASDGRVPPLSPYTTASAPASRPGRPCLRRRPPRRTGRPVPRACRGRPRSGACARRRAAGPAAPAGGSCPRSCRRCPRPRRSRSRTRRAAGTRPAPPATAAPAATGRPWTACRTARPGPPGRPRCRGRPARRPCAGQQRFGQPLADVGLAAGPRRAQVVDAQPGGHRGQERLRRVDRARPAARHRLRPVVAQEGLLDDVLRLADAAEHPVGDREHQRPQPPVMRRAAVPLAPALAHPCRPPTSIARRQPVAVTPAAISATRAASRAPGRRGTWCPWPLSCGSTAGDRPGRSGHEDSHHVSLPRPL